MILVTGATGFVGRALVAAAAARGRAVRGAVRTASPTVPGVEFVGGADLAPDADWGAALRGVDVVIHAAARVHVMHESAPDALEAFREVNLRGTMNLARQAAVAGVRRFVLVSSIKVNGESTAPGRPFRADDTPAPRDPYGVSKREAEDELRGLARETGMEVAIVRPVLVHGPGVKGNVATMLRWLERGIPLPFGAIDNRRSIVALANLVDLLLLCADHPAAAGQTFLVSDGEDLSTTALLRGMARAMEVPARLIPVPAAWLRFAARALRQREIGRRLFESLQVDIGPTTARLAWTPPLGVDDALRETARDVRARRGHA